jgi:hypothetical protein
MQRMMDAIVMTVLASPRHGDRPPPFKPASGTLAASG